MTGKIEIGNFFGEIWHEYARHLFLLHGIIITVSMSKGSLHSYIKNRLLWFFCQIANLQKVFVELVLDPNRKGANFIKNGSHIVLCSTVR